MIFEYYTTLYYTILAIKNNKGSELLLSVVPLVVICCMWFWLSNVGGWLEELSSAAEVSGSRWETGCNSIILKIERMAL